MARVFGRDSRAPAAGPEFGLKAVRGNAATLGGARRAAAAQIVAAGSIENF